MDIAIIVSSCDAYRACWPPFIHGIEKYWSEHPWPIKFITNQLDAPIGETLRGGSEYNWSNRMLKVLLQKVKEPIILILMEDYWLTQPVDTQAIIEFATLFTNSDVDYIRLKQNGATLAKRSYWADNRLFVTDDKEVYRTPLQAGLWRTAVLRDLIRPGETAQEFEIRGGQRSRGTDKMLCVRESSYIQYTDSAVRLGKWTKLAAEYIRREKLSMDFSIGDTVSEIR